MLRILITGGAGFVGSNLALLFREYYPKSHILALDNLKRRGSELNLRGLQNHRIDFIHGDIRCPEDLENLSGTFDVLIDCSAEPSVQSGIQGSPNFVLQTNLVGTQNCLEFARTQCGTVIFLSTSRVYSIESLSQIPLKESKTRFDFSKKKELGLRGMSPNGISEDFPTHLARSFYGTSKLASEMILQEYASAYRMNAFINRCGVIAGPGQFGKVDQGTFSLWVMRHYFKKPLKYTGYGGKGKQVRDLLHPRDLFHLILKQMDAKRSRECPIFNVGGGVKNSVSLMEYTRFCEEITGNQLSIASEASSPSTDIPYYVSDFQKVSKAFDWIPQTSVHEIVKELHTWIQKNEKELSRLCP